ncbi:MAG: DUF928 domain-containing protein, partial [Candidatus Marithrix sp.]|nr:DUF928 domain-containing protein [Candidatus Marithrix sp.]
RGVRGVRGIRGLRGIRGIEAESQKEVKELLPFPKLIAPLAPQHTGFTTTSQPNFYWYMSDDWDGVIEFSLNKIGANEPLLELFIGLPSESGMHEAGMQRLTLSDYDVHLEPDTEYEWFVVIVPDPTQRSGDLLSSGTIKYKPASENLTANLQQVSQEQWYKIYAKAGMWYDAMENICSQIETQPDNSNLRTIRAKLNQEVKMSKVADYDRVKVISN